MTRLRTITVAMIAISSAAGDPAGGQVLLEVASSRQLSVPAVSPGEPAAGRRVNVTAPEYAGTEVAHTLYLPHEWTADWRKTGRRLPIIFEYTGNRFPESGSTGRVQDAALGYGLSSGRYIWVSLPYIREDGKGNQVTWWGDVEKTVAYAKLNVPRIIGEFGGDPGAVFLCGFSRGAIGVNFLGLHDDEIAGLWTAFITHDHFDGVRAWGKSGWGGPLEKYRREAAERLKRVNGRPYLVSQNGSTRETEAFIRSVLPASGNFTFSDIDTGEILGEFPNELAKHPHTDRWPLKPSRYRERTWEWMNRACAGRGWQPQWRPDASSEFEVGTQLRPWTIVDEGWDTIMENCRSMAGVNNIYLIVVMHQEHRPYQAKKFPHNPVRETFMAEDSTVAFFPETGRYGRIKPRLSEHEWIRKTDWLKLTVDECRKRGLGVGAEISHFPLPKSMLRDNPDWLQKDVNGKPVTGKNFCPNHPDVRHYLLALFGDLAGNYDVDYIQTCQFIFTPEDIDEGGGCFCEHCVAAAGKIGIDLEAAIPALREDKNARPHRENWEKSRFEASTALFREIAEAIGKENPGCHLRLNDVYSWNRDPTKRGLDLTAIGKHLGSLVNQDHEEQSGRAGEDFSWRKKWLADNRAHLGPDKPLLSGIAPRMKATPELVRRGIKVAVQHPAQVNGLALKHYDGASFSLLRSFKQGMIEAGVRGLTPTLGWEVEEMQLDGYVPSDEELAEEWGVQTEGRGRASRRFDLPSGTYDVRITYFDGPGGRSAVRLAVGGAERASFQMDEDCNCWRWRRFDDIPIKTGDLVTLTGSSDGDEMARLDFIEFINN